MTKDLDYQPDKHLRAAMVKQNKTMVTRKRKRKKHSPISDEPEPKRSKKDERDMDIKLEEWDVSNRL